jgi:DNA-directed RNA polymerase specialized sigma24 family protein
MRHALLPAVRSPDFCAGPDGIPGLVRRVRGRNSTAIEELYVLIQGLARPHYGRALGGGDHHDRLHETFLIVVEAIETGALRKPEALAPFIHTVLRYQASAFLRDVMRWRGETNPGECEVLQDRGGNPEQIFLLGERKQLARRLIRMLPPSDQEILIRFYFNEQSRERICREMNLSLTQFRLHKWRAKERFIRAAAKFK